MPSLEQQLGLPATNSLDPQNQPLPANQAFQLQSQVFPGKVILQFSIAPSYALYQNRFAFTLSPETNPKNSQNTQTQIGPVNFPLGITKEDPVFGKQIEYQNSLTLIIPILGPAFHKPLLDIAYQGCSAQLCYPVLHQTINLIPNPSAQNLTQNLTQNSLQNNSKKQTIKSTKPWWLALISLFILGILLAFTPCIWPLYPILSGIILGQEKRTNYKSLILSLSYVLGMSISYAFLGWLITKLGASFQADFQRPEVVIVIALVLILMALSMFGIYSLQLPTFMRHWVSLADQKLKGGSFLGVFLMGVISILVISPCASAPLIAVLSLMIQTGNTLLGAISLFILALGMGVPLVLISLGLGKFLPKTGPWMQRVRRLIGVLMLIIAAYLLFRLIPMPWLERSSVRVTNLPALEAEIQKAHPPVLLDFYASWCIECRGLASTLDNPELEPLLKNGTVIQIDVTQDTPSSNILMKTYHVLGLPTLILLNNQKQEAWRSEGNIPLEKLKNALVQEEKS